MYLCTRGTSLIGKSLRDCPEQKDILFPEHKDLVNLQNWLHGNKLSLNLVRTQSLIIRPNIEKIEKQTEAMPSFEIGDQKMNMITDTKYLRSEYWQEIEVSPKNGVQE